MTNIIAHAKLRGIKAVIIDIEIYQKTIDAVNLAKLLSFCEKDISNGKLVTHAKAKKIFEETLKKSSYQK